MQIMTRVFSSADDRQEEDVYGEFYWLIWQSSPDPDAFKAVLPSSRREVCVEFQPGNTPKIRH